MFENLVLEHQFHVPEYIKLSVVFVDVKIFNEQKGQQTLLSVWCWQLISFASKCLLQLFLLFEVTTQRNCTRFTSITFSNFIFSWSRWTQFKSLPSWMFVILSALGAHPFHVINARADGIRESIRKLTVNGKTKTLKGLFSWRCSQEG